MANTKQKAVLREKLRRLHGDNCWICGQEMSFEPTVAPADNYATLDRVVPRAEGGTYECSNVKLACFICNSERGAQWEKDRQAGITARIVWSDECPTQSAC